MQFLLILQTSRTVIGNVFLKKKSLALGPFMALGDHCSNSNKKYEKNIFSPPSRAKTIYLRPLNYTPTEKSDQTLNYRPLQLKPGVDRVV